MFRKLDYESYNHAMWNVKKELPSGIAAVGAAVCSFVLVIPSMAQVLYTGPIAKHTGDVGFEMVFVATVLLYVPCRYAKIKIRGSR